jgi:hypothetical protein
MSATVIAERPQPGAPRTYQFPVVTGGTLETGLTIVVVDLPGRLLVSATMIIK